jgi:hypothetical protein
MSSMYERRGVPESRSVLDLTPCNIVTATRADNMYVVTEYGIVNLNGKSIPDRATAMISIAHPDFRDKLERQAREHGLIPKGTIKTIAANSMIMTRSHEVTTRRPVAGWSAGSIVSTDTLEMGYLDDRRLSGASCGGREAKGGCRWGCVAG